MALYKERREKGAKIKYGFLYLLYDQEHVHLSSSCPKLYETI